MFRGRQSHKMDPKGRLSIPLNYRNDLMASSENPAILTNMSKCLALYPYEAFVKQEQELEAKSSFQPETEAYRRFLISGAVECPFDSQGRILVPQHLRVLLRVLVLVAHPPLRVTRPPLRVARQAACTLQRVQLRQAPKLKVQNE